jgi:hypothetical protein
VLVVDYSCPEGVGDWVERDKLGKVLRVEARRLADNTPLISRARALNAALERLRDSYVLIGDPQLYPSSTAREQIERLAASHPSAAIVAASSAREHYGIVAAPADTLRGVGGYLSAYVGHGAEAIDLRLRLVRHSVTIVTEQLDLCVAAGQRAKIWGSAGLLERRVGLLYGSPANETAAKLLGIGQ